MQKLPFHSNDTTHGNDSMNSNLVLDLHLHSRYSMGVSKYLNLGAIASTAIRKGIDVVAAPDFTHPVWREEMRGELEEVNEGIFAAHNALFILATEVSCVFNQNGNRRLHMLITAPSFEVVKRLCGAFEARGADLMADGRPSLPISARDVVKAAWDVDSRIEVIPAHIWTPWFGLLGSKSGFDSLEECFGDAAERIRVVETGLSSDPAMNWQLQELDNRSIVSFSDAHSASSMGREATVLKPLPFINYDGILSALREGKIAETIEMYPQHGKYYHDGHRRCDVRMTPQETAQAGGRCPVCGGVVTRGVLNRVERLSTRNVIAKQDKSGLLWGELGKPPFRHLVPLREILSAAIGVGPRSQKVSRIYETLIEESKGELYVLKNEEEERITRISNERVARAILAVRRWQVKKEPGFDGKYGKITPIIEE